MRQFAIALLWVVAGGVSAVEPVAQGTDSYVQRERDIAVAQPGPHDGGGMTTAWPFFEQASDFDLIFRKRALHRGAAIGHHVNDKDEIYYVLSGTGALTLQGATSTVVAGDAVLTRNGDSHSLRQVGDDDLVLFIVYRKPASPPAN